MPNDCRNMPQLTDGQTEALVRLLAKATKAGFLPSVADTFCLLDLIDGGLHPQAEPKVDCETEVSRG
jgi:hypothetical protein